MSANSRKGQGKTCSGCKTSKPSAHGLVAVRHRHANGKNVLAIPAPMAPIVNWLAATKSLGETGQKSRGSVQPRSMKRWWPMANVALRSDLGFWIICCQRRL